AHLNLIAAIEAELSTARSGLAGASGTSVAGWQAKVAFVLAGLVDARQDHVGDMQRWLQFNTGGNNEANAHTRLANAITRMIDAVEMEVQEANSVLAQASG